MFDSDTMYFVTDQVTGDRRGPFPGEKVHQVAATLNAKTGNEMSITAADGALVATTGKFKPRD
jgi:hypothetical protein